MLLSCNSFLCGPPTATITSVTRYSRRTLSFIKMINTFLLRSYQKTGKYRDTPITVVYQIFRNLVTQSGVTLGDENHDICAYISKRQIKLINSHCHTAMERKDATSLSQWLTGPIWRITISLRYCYSTSNPAACSSPPCDSTTGLPVACLKNNLFLK